MYKEMQKSLARPKSCFVIVSYNGVFPMFPALYPFFKERVMVMIRVRVTFSEKVSYVPQNALRSGGTWDRFWEKQGT